MNDRKNVKKKTILLIGISLFLLQSSYSQIINPPFESREVNYCDIIKVERNTSNTKIYFKYTSPLKYIKGGWVCAGGDFFIRDNFTNKKYKLLEAKKIPICPEKYNFQFKGQALEFILIFEPIPLSTKKIDVIEDEKSGGFNFFGVNLSSTSKPSSITQNFKSNEDCNNIEYITKSSKPDFTTMLAGVKYAVITEKPANNHQGFVYSALIDYLKAMGFENVEYFDENYKAASNLNKEIFVSLSYSYRNGRFQNIHMAFYNEHLDYSWEFNSEKTYKSGIYSDAKNIFGKALRDMYGYTKNNFNSYYTLRLAKKQTCWTESNLKSEIILNGNKKIEGIYENSASSLKMAKYKVAVKNINGVYHLIYLSGANNSDNWNEGEIKASLESTATQAFYKAKWVMADKSVNNDFYVSFENGLMNVMDSEGKKDLYIKLFPSASDVANTPSETASSGTGYALSSNGYIVTNHHVTNSSSSIKIRGVNNDFSKTYSAKIILEDKKNDLAIIKIDDTKFTSLGKIPYTINREISDVGTSIFVLGYPLRASMGDEVKLTNGIISSKSGFQGDVTSYQISAPIQPGNSGGPLFDNKGKIIGIINAKHIGAENASYAIKSSYLLNLIDLIPTPIKLQTNNLVSGKPLTEQVKILRKFTYIIEVNQ